MKNMLFLCDPAYNTSTEGIEATANAIKAGYKNVSEGIIKTAFSIPYPSILLVGSTKGPDSMKDGGIIFAPKVQDPGNWSAGHLGSEKSRLLDAVEKVKKRVLALIQSHYPLGRGGRDSEINAVLTALANDSYNHAVGLISSMEPLYKTLTQGGMTSKEAWRRVKLYTKGVFDSIHDVRSLAAEGTPEAMVWAVLCAHRVAGQYHAHQWINHPRVSSILALSALEHEGDKLAALEKEVESIRKELKSAVDKLTRLIKRVEVLESKVN